MTGDRLYLQHISDAIDKIESYAAVGREEFLHASHWHDAVIRQLEIIGEATKRLSPALRDRNSNVPWRQIAGLRDVLVHDYMGVDLSAVWEVVQKDLPPLKANILSILADVSE